MGSFNASLRTIGDRRGIPATVTIEHGRIVINAGDQPIGDWSLEEIHLEPTGGSSYRMAAEGEQILIDVPDTEAFRSAIEARSKMRKRPKVRSEKTRQPKTRQPKTPVAKAKVDKATVEKAKVEVEQVSGTRASRVRPQRAETEKITEGTRPEQSQLNRLDRFISAAERRWGSLLPAWVFTRIMVGVLAGALVLTIIFPGLVSSFLLISGLLLVLLGAIAYTDQILAAKWLPGRMTPMHVLLIGVAVLMAGVLVGLVA